MKKNLWLILTAFAAIFVTILWMNEAPGSCYAKGFYIGSSVCHQIPSHSFIHDGIQFPICARCTGLYLGSAFGITYFFALGKKKGLPERGFLFLLLLLAILWAGDGVNSFASDFLNRPFLYKTTNLIRLVTGSGMGLVMSTALVTLFNMTVWQDGTNAPVIDNIKQLLLYFGVSVALALILLASGPLAFQILAGVAVVTVLTIITLLYTIFWIILTHKENKSSRLSELIPHFFAGFATALIQVLLLNLLRGFILG